MDAFAARVGPVGPGGAAGSGRTAGSGRRTRYTVLCAPRPSSPTTTNPATRRLPSAGEPARGKGTRADCCGTPTGALALILEPSARSAAVMSPQRPELLGSVPAVPFFPGLPLVFPGPRGGFRPSELFPDFRHRLPGSGRLRRPGLVPRF